MVCLTVLMRTWLFVSLMVLVVPPALPADDVSDSLVDVNPTHKLTSATGVAYGAVYSPGKQTSPMTSPLDIRQTPSLPLTQKKQKSQPKEKPASEELGVDTSKKTSPDSTLKTTAAPVSDSQPQGLPSTLDQSHNLDTYNGKPLHDTYNGQPLED